MHNMRMYNMCKYNTYLFASTKPAPKALVPTVGLQPIEDYWFYVRIFRKAPANVLARRQRRTIHCYVRVYMYIYIYIYNTCMYVYIYICYIYSIYRSIYVYVYTYIYIYICIGMCVCVRFHVQIVTRPRRRACICTATQIDTSVEADECIPMFGRSCFAVYMFRPIPICPHVCPCLYLSTGMCAWIARMYA